MSFDRDAFHRAAVRTPSHEDVTAMRRLLVETLEAAGQDPSVDEAGNVVAERRSDGAPVGREGEDHDPTGQDEDGASDSEGTHLVLNTHLDTVPPHVPYERDGDTVRGRGACDAKGPLAALVDAFLSAPVGDGRLTLAVSSDEETAQSGGAHLGATLSADGYVVGEPTGLDVCHAARGNFGGTVTVRGEGAHASTPGEATGPVDALPALLDALDRYDDRRGPGEHAVLGAPTLATTRVVANPDGSLGRVPAECTVGVDRRTVPPETVGGFVADLESYLAGRLPEAYDVEVAPAYPDSHAPEAFATDPGADLVRTLAEASGGAVRPFGAATEASQFADDAPVVVFGPGVLADEEGPVAHADREYVSRSAVGTAAGAVRTTVATLLD